MSTTRPTTTRRLTAVAGLVCAGCYGHVQAGYSHPLGDHDGDRGVLVTGHYGLVGDNRPRNGLAFGLAARVRVSDQVKSGGLAAETMWVGWPYAALTPYARVGVHLVNAGKVDGGADGGAGSPYGELGLQIPFGEVRGICAIFESPRRKFVSLSVGAGYDLWLGDADSRGWLMVALGIGVRENVQECHGGDL